MGVTVPIEPQLGVTKIFRFTGHAHPQVGAQPHAPDPAHQCHQHAHFGWCATGHAEQHRQQAQRPRPNGVDDAAIAGPKLNHPGDTFRGHNNNDREADQV